MIKGFQNLGSTSRNVLLQAKQTNFPGLYGQYLGLNRREIIPRTNLENWRYLSGLENTFKNTFNRLSGNHVCLIDEAVHLMVFV